jgi:hypothetical protein
MNEPMPQQMQYMPQGPQLIRANSDFDKWRLDTETIAEQLEYQLKGFVWDKNLKKWVQGENIPAMNSVGAIEVSNVIRDLSNRVTFLSELDDDKIMNICLDINQELVGLLFMNWDAFEIRKENAGWVVAKIMNIVYIGLLRAKGRGEAEIMARQEIISRNINTNENRGGGWSPLNMFRKKQQNNQGAGY